MSQISPPIRILGLCAIGLIAAWFVFLKPGDPAPEPPPAPAANAQPNIAAGGASATTGVGKVAEAANQLKANADAKAGESAAAPSAAAGSATAPATSTDAPNAATPISADALKAATKAGMPTGVLKAIADRKVILLFVWNPEAADDAAVNRELRDVMDHRKGVYLKKTRLKDISRYGLITRGVDVKQSPTLVVVDRKLQAESLVGYADHATIEQAVDDARRAGK